MSGYDLGDRVIVSDYLRRVDLSRLDEPPASRVRVYLADAGVDMAGALPTKLWVPQSVHRPAFDELGIWIPTDNRNNPTPGHYTVTLPVPGVVVQKITLQDGWPVYDGYGRDWKSSLRRTGYRVAYRLDSRPLIVWPSMITPEAAS